MDVAYIRRRSLWHDLSILLRTIPAVLLRQGGEVEFRRRNLRLAT